MCLSAAAHNGFIDTKCGPLVVFSGHWVSPMKYLSAHTTPEMREKASERKMQRSCVVRALKAYKWTRQKVKKLQMCLLPQFQLQPPGRRHMQQSRVKKLSPEWHRVVKKDYVVDSEEKEIKEDEEERYVIDQGQSEEVRIATDSPGRSSQNIRRESANISDCVCARTHTVRKTLDTAMK